MTPLSGNLTHLYYRYRYDIGQEGIFDNIEWICTVPGMYLHRDTRRGTKKPALGVRGATINMVAMYPRRGLPGTTVVYAPASSTVSN